MPNYRYRSTDPSECDTCAEGFEVLQRLSDDPLDECPKCGVAVRRVIGKTQLSAGRWKTKKMLSDGNLKRLGFKKLVKEGEGRYVDVLAD